MSPDIERAAQALADACVRPGHWQTIGAEARAGYVKLAGVVAAALPSHPIPYTRSNRKPPNHAWVNFNIRAEHADAAERALRRGDPG